MEFTLENFRPKLRTGKILPRGTHIIFETQRPYNQIVLPMRLADMILLCSGHFTVREIVSKIYLKQKSVPFRAILQTIHTLHEGGFLENGHELKISSDLRSWIGIESGRWQFNIPIANKIVLQRSFPVGFYLISLSILALGILGMSHLPGSLSSFHDWFFSITLVESIGLLYILNSIVQSLRNFVRMWQDLLLSGQAFNLSFKVSFTGVVFHVGNEAHHSISNSLYLSMFYLSQIAFPWAISFVALNFLNLSIEEPLIAVACLNSMLSLSPFIESDGLKLTRKLLASRSSEVTSWEFEETRILNLVHDNNKRQDKDFSRICSIWGGIWLMILFAFLHAAARNYALEAIANPTLPRAFALAAWLTALAYTFWIFYERFGPMLTGLVQRSSTTNKSNAWDSDSIIKAIENLPIFSHFQEQSLRKIVQQSKIKSFSTNQTVIRQGGDANEIFVLLDGTIQVVRINQHQESEWLTELNATSVFGEAALIDTQPRSAQVSALNAVTVLEVPVGIVKLLAEETHVIRELNDFKNAILVNQFFSSSPVFRSLSSESIDYLSNRGILEYVDRGQVVFRQGDPGEDFYLILRGAVDVFVHNQHVTRIYQGSFFGEIALIANIPRTATIVTAEPSAFFKVSSSAFWEILVRHLDLGIFLETVSEARLTEDLNLQLARTGSDSK